MWNYVLLPENQWYAVDTTWDDQNSTWENTDGLYYTYLLCSADSAGFDATFAEEHIENNQFTDNASSKFTYPRLSAESRYITFKWGGGQPISAFYSDSFFNQTSFQYNHQLAWLTLGLELASHTVNEALYWGADKYAKDSNGTYVDVEAQRTRYIRNAYEDMGFDINSVLYKKYDINLNDKSDRAAFSIAQKRLENGKTLIAIVLRGGGYGCEWSSNFHVEDGILYHRAFKDCANDAFITLKQYFESIDGEIAIWITGYSRAGATANLLAAMIDDYAETDNRLNPQNIFTYTFATPQGVTENVDGVHSAKYNNIFNIVNPCDFVPKVAFSSWNFTHYGITKYFDVPLSQRGEGQQNMKILSAEAMLIKLLLQAYPTASSSTSVQGVISELLEFKNMKKNVGGSYGYAVWESLSLKVYAEVLRGRYGDTWDKSYVMAMMFLSYDAIGQAIWNALGDNEDLKDIVLLVFSLFELHDIPSDDIVNLISSIAESNLWEILFKVNTLSSFSAVGDEHLGSTYLKYLRKDESSAFMSNSVWKAFSKTWYYVFHCPVDIRVYDSNGIIVANVENHKIISADIPVVINDESTEFCFLENPESYRIEVIPTELGAMSYTVTELDKDLNVERRTNYTDIAIDVDQTYSVNVILGEDSQNTYDLTRIENGETEQITANEVLTENYTTSLNVEITGSGTVSGVGQYVKGDTATLRACPTNGYHFAGWYSDGILISKDLNYRVELFSDLSITALFEKNHTEHIWSEPSDLDIPGGHRAKMRIWVCEECGMTKSEYVGPSEIHDSWQWQINNGSILYIFGDGENGLIPDYDDFTDAPWHSYASIISELIVGDGITSIGSNAFGSLINLKSVEISNSVNFIHQGAFMNCNSIEVMSLPFLGTARNAAEGDGVLGSIFGIKEGGIYQYSKREEAGLSGYPYAIPSSLKRIILTDSARIPFGAFYNCSSLEEVDLNEGLLLIEDYAFDNCTSLLALSIPESVHDISMGILSGCDHITEISIPFIGANRNAKESAEGVLGYLFGQNSGGTMQYYSMTETESGGYSLSGKSYAIPESLKKVSVTDATQIPLGAFFNCDGLTEIHLNEGIEEVGNFAFAHCGGLNNLELPNTVTSLSGQTLIHCDALESLTIPFVGASRDAGGDSGVFGYPFGTTSEGTMQYFAQSGTSFYGKKYDIPSGLKNISVTDATRLSFGAFSNIVSIEMISINGDVDSISDD